MKTKILTLVAFLLFINTYAQIGFQKHEFHSLGHYTNSNSVFSIDVDGDMDLDVISSTGNIIVWSENINGQGSFGIQQIISSDGGRSIFATDIDGDGDADVVSSSVDEVIAWHENTDGEGQVWTKHIIANINGICYIKAADIDNDGDMDVVSGSSSFGTISWYRNTDGQGSFQYGQSMQNNSVSSIFIADINGDGDMDVISAANYYDEIVWNENIDGQGSFGTMQIISSNTDGANSVYASDIDGDGDVDVISASKWDSKIAWYENIDSQGSFGSQQIITEYSGEARQVFCCDIDGDGDNDVISSSEYGLDWNENIDGLGSFGVLQNIHYGNFAVVDCIEAGDIDGDGDLDVITGEGINFGNEQVWYENTNGQGDFGERQFVTARLDDIVSAFFYDIDGDNDMDILYGSDRTGWIENTDGNGNFFEYHEAHLVNAAFLEHVCAIDIDNDGDLDILKAAYNQINLAWYENNGQGDFDLQHIILDNVDGVNSVFPSDIDGDGDQDVLYTLSYSTPYSEFYEIGWFENTDGQGSFGDKNIILSTITDPYSIYAADFDGDGDTDVVSGGLNGILWYENTDGQGNFGSEYSISSSDWLPTLPKDMDGDGDIDVLSKSSPGTISWHENTDGLGNFGIQHIITTDFDNPWAVYAVDIDLDGDNDVLSTSTSLDIIAYFENTNGQGSFGTMQIIDDIFINPKTIYAADVDGDSDMDLLVSSLANLAWYENLSPLGVEDNTLTSFSIFPNPTTGTLYINSEVNIAQIDISNSLGQLVLSNTSKSSIDMTTLAQGLYILKITDKAGNKHIEKVLKE